MSDDHSTRSMRKAPRGAHDARVRVVARGSDHVHTYSTYMNRVRRRLLALHITETMNSAKQSDDQQAGWEKRWCFLAADWDQVSNSVCGGGMG